ncbi:MAG: NADH:flavin oxidoreductase [Alphaproteobacteria bacterium]|jgi:2,4-dienoyl-CoA reductase-like NADH-dependent reductase (Old Yellow Enzyme family)|nr:12-oxophytodienoate reductase [Rhodospirillaceae bacterium]MDP6404899.1 NADH:flavin oxidoreductase [Alphaproteobacteria bacterium]MDP6621569.1 NADH:flavin oxidoreductase [Alphaproteobacteria bacterium]|tara:strand:- start:84 stop:1166 length:1083 start_codon:yes stop_codon:yes gene_type:complete
MSPSAQILFDPIKINNLTLPNRLAMAPMTRCQSPGGVATAEVAAYYRRRTEGGIGLIITEGTSIGHVSASGNPAVPAIHGEAALVGWKLVVDAVHEAGGCIIPQLWHIGAARQPWMKIDIAGHSPSGQVLGDFGEGVEMSQTDIDEVVAAFASSAADAQRIGFDGVEIHGAHGYLIDQFLWQGSNQRNDGYGGSLENRLRFALEVVAAVRQATSPDFPIDFRFSQWKSTDYEARLAETPDELERLVVPLAEAGVDVFHASTRRYWVPEFEGSDLNLAGWTKKLSGKPTITVGSVGLDDISREAANPSDITELVERLDRDEFDLVAVGRALLSDAEWANKVREGRQNEIAGFSKDSLGALN